MAASKRKPDERDIVEARLEDGHYDRLLAEFQAKLDEATAALRRCHDAMRARTPCAPRRSGPKGRARWPPRRPTWCCRRCTSSRPPDRAQLACEPLEVGAVVGRPVHLRRAMQPPIGQLQPAAWLACQGMARRVGGDARDAIGREQGVGGRLEPTDMARLARRRLGPERPQLRQEPLDDRPVERQARRKLHEQRPEPVPQRRGFGAERRERSPASTSFAAWVMALGNFTAKRKPAGVACAHRA